MAGQRSFQPAVAFADEHGSGRDLDDRTAGRRAPDSMTLSRRRAVRDETTISVRKPSLIEIAEDPVPRPRLADDAPFDLERPGFGEGQAQGEGIDEELAGPEAQQAATRTAARTAIAAGLGGRIMASPDYSRP